MHQEYEMPVDINCAIRRIINPNVWYLHSYDIDNNQANWTSKYQRAHQFQNEEAATRFTKTYLGDTRAKECDTFSEFETWSI